MKSLILFIILLKWTHGTIKIKYGVTSNYRPICSKSSDIKWASFYVVHFFNKLMSKIKVFNLYVFSYTIMPLISK